MQRSPELEALIAAWFDAFSRGDGEWIRRHVSDEAEVRLIGTDPGDWHEGGRVREFLGGAVDGLNGAVEIAPADVLAVRDGSIGWGVTRATIRLPGGGEVGFRWSAVFREEDGAWRAVQIHGSFGVPDAETFGGEL